MSSWIGSLAWDLGDATDILAFTGCEFTTTKPAPSRASVSTLQPSSRASFGDGRLVRLVDGDPP
jgi:hypothetical protein